MIMPHAFRLTLGMDLKQSILTYVKQKGMKAGSLLSCVGCLSHASIRLANESKSLELVGPLEILTLTGTLTPEHVHLHISVADQSGRVYGGHLQDGSVVSHTAEVCLAEYANLSFTREPDTATGFTELVVEELEH
ncbi:DUF296 domain-containing protein [Photobacterium gaetbulicola]|uniref:DNA-binding protein n=2 Tax=Photobacterium gaetbulicola TaxID=1295392 RepID=A0A0C5WZY6_9GAMM|nr:PPC domain-containing DNA-binding protein [Photobacterium gaetbulicola]AJR08630.1 DNA-binding protein [Photobacterium gaetbulicola Gung47]KHT63715.1 DNA-binding protein [Photobacterium gaetbulicola]PSU02929.1 DUF296 domain-containing protein [Photobacterium gaetbulicola]